MKGIKLVTIWILFAIPCKAQQRDSDAASLHRLQKAILAVTINDNISPVVASRMFVYPNIAFYNGITDKSKIIKELQAGNFDYPPSSLVAVHAFATVARSMLYTKTIFEDSLKQILHCYKELDPEVRSKAETQGKEIGLAVISIMKADGFSEIRSMPKYHVTNDEKLWRPTGPGYFQAVEPNWGKVHPLLVHNMDLTLIKPLPFDTSRNSALYREAMEVYLVSKNSKGDHKEIASFWDCNPFALHVYGHRMEAEKKMSPVGHWICIAESICKIQNKDAAAASLVYTTLSAGIFDALIYCWELKYRFQFLRPEHYITSYIDPEWEPLLQSPPFPEFPSGHSVISATAAEILTYHFGSIPYEDNTEAAFGIASRKFLNFYQAADEAAISRVYGGIHFRHAAEEGKSFGSQLGKQLLEILK